MKTKKQKEKEMLLSIIEEQKELNKSLLEHNDRLLKENRELRNQISSLQAEIVFSKMCSEGECEKHPPVMKDEESIK